MLLLLARSRPLTLLREEKTWRDVLDTELFRARVLFDPGNFTDATLGAMVSASAGVVDGPGAIKTLVFNANVEGITFSTVSGTMVAAWQTGDDADSGSGGCLKWTTSTNGDNERRGDLALAWTDYGVPANATVTSITLASFAVRSASKTGQSAQTMVISIQDGSGNPVYAGGVDLFDSTDVLTTTSAWQRIDMLRTFPVLSANQPATSAANLLITYESTSAGGTNVDFRVDDIAFVVAYTLPDRTGISPDIVLGAVTSSATAGVAIAATETTTLGAVAIAAAGTVAGGGGVSGDVTQTLGGLTDSAAGVVAIAATASSTLGALTDSATGAVAIAGVESSTLGTLTGTETGAVAIAGTETTTLGAVTDVAAGAVAIAATESSTLGTLTDAATGTVAITGTASDTLGSIGISAQGGAPIVSGTLASTLGAISETASGAVAITGAESSALGAVAATAAGAVAIAATASPALGVLGETATASVEIGAATSEALGAVIVSAQAVADTRGVVDETLGALTSVGGASSSDSGVAAITLGTLAVSAQGHGPPVLVGILIEVLDIDGALDSLVLVGAIDGLNLAATLTAIDPNPFG